MPDTLHIGKADQYSKNLQSSRKYRTCSGRIAIVGLCAISHLFFPLLEAQVRLASQDWSDVARQRAENAAARQKNSLLAMSKSIDAQQAAVQRQRQETRGFGPAEFSRGPESVAPMTGPSCDALPSGEIDALVDSAAQRTSVSPILIRSVMRQESAFRPCAVSSKGAIGLMQLLPSTADDLGVKDAFDPEANVLGGAKLLRHLMDHYDGNLGLTLGAYNAGEAKVDAVMGIPMIAETVDYVKRVLSHIPSAHREVPDSGEANDQSVRESAPDTNLRLTRVDEGE